MCRRKCERGQGMTEYALIVALVAVVTIAALFLVGLRLQSVLYGIGEVLQSECGQVSARIVHNYCGEGGNPPSGNGGIVTWPSNGQITQRWWLCHRGLDIADEEGTPIVTVSDGTVAYAGWNNSGYGKMVVIDHGSYQSLYAHLSSVWVSKGEIVNASQVIGLMGNTGFSTGPHLHFEIRWGSEMADPLTLLP